MLKSLVSALLLASPAFGSSGDAWAKFAAEVETACLRATESMLSSASAVVDPFGSESYGLAIVSGRVADGRTARVICVLDKKTRDVEIGGELDVAVMQPELRSLTAADMANAALDGELFCGFDAKGEALLVAAGYVASHKPAEAIVSLSGRLLSLKADGGFDAIINGAAFTGPDGSAEVKVRRRAYEGGEAPAHPATLTVQPNGGVATIAEGNWECGP